MHHSYGAFPFEAIVDQNPVKRALIVNVGDMHAGSVLVLDNEMRELVRGRGVQFE